MKEAYARAARFLPWALRRHVFNAAPRPVWAADGTSFCYRRQHGDGWEFLHVDAASGARRGAFDHAVLANALAAATGTAADARRLDIGAPRPAGDAVEFVAKGQRWRFDGALHRLGPAVPPHELASPDGRYVAFVHGNDLWLGETATGRERPLTTDGTEGRAYAKSPDANLMVITHRRAGLVLPPAALWSPDLRRLLTHVMDERGVAEAFLVQTVPPNGGHRPVLHRWRVALVGDVDLALAHHVVLDVETGAATFADHPPRASQNASPVERGNAWWGSDSATAYFLHADRGDRLVQLCAMDAVTGWVQVLIEERSDRFIELNHATGNYPNVRIVEGTNETVWFSQRDGWSHLWLYDAAGRPSNRITGGEWVVHDILHLDAAARTVTFTASGIDAAEDPYLRKIYRTGLDGSDLVALTPDALDHDVIVARPILPNIYDPVASHDPARGIAPGGGHMVVTASRLDSLPVTRLLRADGCVVAEVETATLAPALAVDWRWPEPIVAKGRDGNTDIHGALWLPHDFDPSRRYPILDLIYPGPQRIQTPKAAFPGDAGRFALYALAQAYAELGLAVVTLDGMGTPYRSKAFHDVCVGNMGDAGGLADHVAALLQLARERPYLDTTRVGIIGHSGGGFAAARAVLAFPHFFTVAIASAGNHDQRGYSAAWGERYQGLLEGHEATDNYDAASNASLAPALRGKLMLATGEMDENVHLAHTMRLADALIAANKDFDLVIVPNANHATLVSHPWFVRKRFDFLARHLLHTEPPADFHFPYPATPSYSPQGRDSPANVA